MGKQKILSVKKKKKEKLDFHGGSVVKNTCLPVQETLVQFLVREDPTCHAVGQLGPCTATIETVL